MFQHRKDLSALYWCFIPLFRLDVRLFPLWCGNERESQTLSCIMFIWLLFRLYGFSSLASAG